MGTCFSTNVVSMYISWIGVTKLALGATYHRYSSSNQHDCIGSSSDTCYFHCDEGNADATFNCNNVGTCIFSCEDDYCAWASVINGDNAAQLTIQGKGLECLVKATVNAPSYGDLTFDRMIKEKAYKEMFVNAGNHTGSIYIDCTHGNGDECKKMQVDARKAQFLKMVIDDVGSSEIDGDEKKNNPAYIYCPRDSDYSGSEDAPCVIENNQSMNYVKINAYYGTPRDMVLYGTGSKSKTDLICHLGTTTDFTASSMCYITHAPTSAPTFSPTSNPTPAPTSNPTPAPTSNPTPAPTFNPTPAPTFNPTSAPTDNPTNNPTFNPTPAPTSNPTPAPTLNPTPAPTSNPTPAPTLNPTPAPTLNPTPQPTKGPTKNPTTPSPTPPGTFICGESSSGPYSGSEVQFMVNLPFEGDLEFDASGSEFTIVAMEAKTELNTYIMSDGDLDGIIRLVSKSAGNYKFTILGGAVTSTFHVTTTCTSSSPTAAPTEDPTPAPTKDPTPAPTDSPTSLDPTPGPTANPTSLAPTAAPTEDPTDAPTENPTDAPTEQPSDDPSAAPTDSPTDDPTDAPTEQPSAAPTDAPTDEPTPAPTALPTATRMTRCGDQITDEFRGEPVYFVVNVPFESADLEFDATASDFMVTNIDAFIASGSMYLGSGISGKLSLQRLPTGYYKFILHGSVSRGIYDINIICTSSSPSPAPTSDPTPAPTDDPTKCPTSPPTNAPTIGPTMSPTAAPSDDDGPLDDDEVITKYEIRVQVCDASDSTCEFSESDITEAIEEMYPNLNIDISIDEVRTVGNTVIMDVEIESHEDDVLQSSVVQDDIETMLSPDFVDVYAQVTAIEEDGDENKSIVDLENVNMTELFREYKYLLFMVILFAGTCLCCCLGCVLFWRKQNNQKQLMQLQWLELNKMQQEVNDGNPSSCANTNTSGAGEAEDNDANANGTNNAGEGGDADKNAGDTDFDGASMLINGGLPKPYVFVTPQSPSSDDAHSPAVVYPQQNINQMSQQNQMQQNQMQPNQMQPNQMQQNQMQHNQMPQNQMPQRPQRPQRPHRGPYAMAQMNQNMMMAMNQMQQMQPQQQVMPQMNYNNNNNNNNGEHANEEEYDYYYDTDEDANAEEIYGNVPNIPVMQTPGDM